MKPTSSLTLEALSQKNAKAQILVVDDEEGILKAIQRQTFELPIQVLTCSNIAQAKDYLNQFTIDIAFVDHQLGDTQTGLEFLTELSEEHPNTFRVIFTGESDFTFAVNAINLGHIDAFLPKPWSTEQLHALIRQGAASSHLRFMNATLNEELTQRNFELECLNRDLEDIVTTRTEELAATNQRLHVYRDDIVHLETQAAISQLVRGLAHELNNPLGIILGHSQRLKRLRKADGDVQDCMLVVETEIERCKKLIERLRSYSVTDDAITENCTVQNICDIAIERLVQRGFELPQLTFVEEIPTFSASPRAFARVFDQIIENAIYARAQKITISHSFKHERLSIHIDNDGITPVDEEIRNAVKPFYSTKQTGTGLGLSIASAILAENGCTLNFDYNPRGTGARCSILMPIPDNSSFESGNQLPTIKPSTMLILDDEPLITELILEALSESKTEAAVAASLREAHDIMSNQEISCCIVDASLPDGSGCAFVNEIVQKYPNLKHHVALISGDTSQPAVIELQEALNCPILSKPFNMAALNTLIKSIL